MRHAVKGRKLGRTTAHREALFRNQLQSLVNAERIVTTLPKAKELRPIAERVVTRGKHGTVHDRRWVQRWVLDRDLVKKVFDDIAPRFTERPGGYLRIVKLGPRKGDGAEMAVLEFVDREAAAAPAQPEPKKGGRTKEAAPAKKEAAPAKKKAASAKKEAASAKKEAAPAEKEGGRKKKEAPKAEAEPAPAPKKSRKKAPEAGA